MKLTSGTSRVELWPVRYEFPNRSAEGDDFDWDSNWLIVHGEVELRGLRWSFDDPCMTTREAADLARWLRGVGEGRVEPDGLSGSGSLWFTEPNITFGLHSRTNRSATIMVSLSAESEPPSATTELREEVARGIQFDMALEEVIDAAEAWEQELAAFPER